MKYRELGQTGFKVSVLSFGAWQIGGPPFWEPVDEKNAEEAIQTSLECGINLFDTAPVYGFGFSEKLVGRALKSVRDSIYIATKCGLAWREDGSIYNDLKPASIRREAEESLRRLGTDRIDLYQIHWPSSTEPPEPALEEMARLKDEGKIRAIGVSNFDANLLRRAMAVTQIDSVQPKYNLLERDAEKELFPLCTESKIGVLAYSPLASGLLTGKYDASSAFNDWRGKGFFGIFRPDALKSAYTRLENFKATASNLGMSPTHTALNWALANPAVTTLLVGVKTAQQMKNNVECLEVSFGGEEKNRVDKT